jgi:heme exporter protein CcmD
MNFDLGPYSDFIWPSYAISALGLAAATAWTIIAWRKAKARLAALERK